MARNQLNFTALRSGVTTLREKITLNPFPPPGGLGLGRLNVVKGPGSIGFKLNGTLIWLIDVRRFAGTPALTVDSPHPHTTRIRLKNARFPGTQMPADFVCVIGETGLFLSPNSSGAWAHSKPAVTLSERTELWHTRLAVRDHQNATPVVNENLPRKIRAVWSQDYQPSGIPKHSNVPFHMSLDPNDRDQIVRLSSDFTIPNYRPRSIHAQKLFLTALGAWMEVFGNWGDPLPIVGNDVFSVEQWQHRAAMARDNYVCVVYAGYHLPFGHHTSLVKVTERKFQAIGGGHTKAYLRQYFCIIPREPLKTYDSYLNAVQQRGFPYETMRITTLVTPTLDQPEIDGFGRYSFFPKVGGDYFQFHLVGQDAEQQAQQTSEFSTPLYFVERGGDYTNAVGRYNTSNLNQRNLEGQKIAYAPSNKAGDTTLHTDGWCRCGGSSDSAGDRPAWRHVGDAL